MPHKLYDGAQRISWKKHSSAASTTYAAYNHSTLCAFYRHKRILKSVSSKCFLYLKRIFSPHKFFSFVNDFLMFSRLSKFIASLMMFVARRLFLQYKYICSVQHLKVKIDVCLLNFEFLFKILMRRLTGNSQVYFFSHTAITMSYCCVRIGIFSSSLHLTFIFLMKLFVIWKRSKKFAFDSDTLVQV